MEVFIVVNSQGSADTLEIVDVFEDFEDALKSIGPNSDSDILCREVRKRERDNA